MDTVSKQSTTISAIVDTMPADLLTPLAVYLKLSENSDHSFLLESVEGGRQLARYSFIGADPFEIVTGGREAFEQLKDHFSQVKAAVNEENVEFPPFMGGAIGYLGFDACEWFEPSLASGGDASGACSFMFYRSIVAFDHAKQVIKIISLDMPGTASPTDRNAEIRRILEHPNVPMPDRSEMRSLSLPSSAVSNWRREDFESAVQNIKELIDAGECYQAVLSQCFTRETPATPIAVYRALRSVNPSPYMFLLRFGKKAIVGASPEMLIKCEGNKLQYRPIAGTRHRGATPAEDDRLGEELRCDTKEVAEHLMLVDLGRNDL
ncbi:MAG TPA: chorismate-binding protein, partial [Pyrinomonadaceae bacterium]|nr:chorismate-binding protein [Pyrinomonadaceae bacterium]